MNENHAEKECSNCGAHLIVSPNCEVFYCKFCGQKNYMHDENHQKYTYRKVDDARIREADVKEVIRLEELRIERLRLEEEAQYKRATMLMKVIPLTVLCVLVFLLAVLMLVVDAGTQLAFFFLEIPLIIVTGIAIFRTKSK